MKRICPALSQRKSSLLRRTRLAAAVLAVLLVPLPSRAAEADGPAQLTPAVRRLGEQLALSFDAGDSYPIPGGSRKLRRLPGTLALRTDAAQTSAQRLTARGQVLEGYSLDPGARGGISLLNASREEKLRQRANRAAFDRALNRTRQTAAGKSANPVFVDPDKGLRLLVTEDLVVKLKLGTDAKDYFGAVWNHVAPVWGTTDQFVLHRPGATAEEVLAEVNRRARDEAVEWAEPDFISEVVRCSMPDDPDLATRQWHLNNTGQRGGTPGADARVVEAWATTIGSPNVVIAVMDDGIQINHPDLAANIFQNPGENPFNNLDDDGNGLINDVQGWDFFDFDSDPSPQNSADNHGTALSGVAAAVGNNGVGVAGVAYGSKLMPVKIIGGDFVIGGTAVSRALRYAAGLGPTGLQAWRGADVLNISLIFLSGLNVESAFQDVATKGRGGKGCPIFVAAGNAASAWQPVDYVVPNAGTYTLRWEYSKDGSDVFVTGDDTVWLDSVIWPDGTHETFEGGLPSGWTTSSTAPWTSVTDGTSGNHAMHGWNGQGSRSLRAGSIGHNRTTYVETTRTLTAGVMRSWVWVSSELSYDYFRFKVDGVQSFRESGVPILTTNVDYPANLPIAIAVGSSTDFDFRSDYSQYGAKLDFVAPSDGGAAGIYTTDRTGAAGYNDGEFGDNNYTPGFGGTSSATPLAAGVAALVLSLNPYLTASDVRTLLRDTCDKIGGVAYDAAGRNPFFGSGRINAARAVQATKADLTLALAAAPEPGTQGDITTYTITVRNVGPARSGPIVLTNQLPPNVVFGVASPAPASRVGNLLTFAGPTLGGGGTLVFTITVTNLSPGTNLVLAGVQSDITDLNPANNEMAATVTVLPVPVITMSDAQVGEGTVAPGGRLFFNVTLDRPSSKVVTVSYATATNTAGKKDFKAALGTLTFLPGMLGTQIAVDALVDALDEEDESLLVKLSKPVNAVLGNTQAVGTILDDDMAPTLTTAPVTVREGNSGARPANFTFRLSAPSGRRISVELSTQPGSAEAGLDFIPTNAVLLFPPGTTQQRFAVPVQGDTIYEGTESFEIRMQNPTNTTPANLSYTCTILDSEKPPKLAIGDVTLAESDSEPTNAMFRLQLSGAAAVPVAVRFETTNGSARGDADFVATNGMLNFLPGQTNLFLEIPVLGDLLSESNEFFSVRLSSPTNATLKDSLARGIILDQDPLPGVTFADAAVDENPAGPTNLTLTASLSAPSGRTVTVKFASANGSATAPADYLSKSGVLTFPPGVTHQDIVVTVNRDDVVESSETFLIKLSFPVNATLITTQAVATILGPAPAPRLAGFEVQARLVEGRFLMRFETSAGQRYAIEYTHDLGDAAAWKPLSSASEIAGSGEVVEVSDPVPEDQTRCFYRVRLLP